MSEGAAPENSTETAPGQKPGSGPGALLLAARERLRVSPQEVADELKLPTHVIEALEKDDYARMPPTVFSRGYLRSYARLLDLDPDALLKLYPQLAQEPEPGTQVSVVPLWKRKALAQIGAMVAAGLLVVVVLLSVLFGTDEKETVGEGLTAGSSETAPVRTQTLPPEVPATPASAQEANPETAEAEDIVKPQDGVEAEDLVNAQDGIDAEDVVTVDVEDELPRAPTPTGRPAAIRGAPAPLAEQPGTPAAGEVAAQPARSLEPIAAGVRRITESGDDRLILTFTADCWVDVKSSDGEKLYSDLNRAGRQLELVGDGPFRVMLGYAPGVELSFNGEAVPLAARTRNNVANLVLGQ